MSKRKIQILIENTKQQSEKEWYDFLQSKINTRKNGGFIESSPKDVEKTLLRSKWKKFDKYDDITVYKSEIPVLLDSIGINYVSPWHFLRINNYNNDCYYLTIKTSNSVASPDPVEDNNVYMICKDDTIFDFVFGEPENNVTILKTDNNDIKNKDFLDMKEAKELGFRNIQLI